MKREPIPCERFTEWVRQPLPPSGNLAIVYFRHKCQGVDAQVPEAPRCSICTLENEKAALLAEKDALIAENAAENLDLKLQIRTRIDELLETEKA